MGKINQLKSDDQYRVDRPFQDDFSSKAKVNLNDLLKKRQEDKKVDKRANIAILSGAAAVSAAILLALTL
tara:strand:- start:279 stop:488 length:210 start_codon:yes stop_codon:yes gene_type:complete